MCTSCEKVVHQNLDRMLFQKIWTDPTDITVLWLDHALHGIVYNFLSLDITLHKMVLANSCASTLGALVSLRTGIWVSGHVCALILEATLCRCQIQCSSLHDALSQLLSPVVQTSTLSCPHLLQVII